MKLLLIIAVVLVGVWYWRNNRRSTIKAPRTGRPAGGAAQEMLPCAVCSLHVARSEALIGKSGVYCCLAHRRQAEPE